MSPIRYSTTCPVCGAEVMLPFSTTKQVLCADCFQIQKSQKKNKVIPIEKGEELPSLDESTLPTIDIETAEEDI